MNETWLMSDDMIETHAEYAEAFFLGARSGTHGTVVTERELLSPSGLRSRMQAQATRLHDVIGDDII